MEKRSVRVIAEITPESWRALRERDRAFADLFHVIPMEEPSEAETLRILVNVARQMEEQYHCWFALDIVPTVFELHRRFVRDAAFPGKAAGFLRRLAVRHSEHVMYRAAALQEMPRSARARTQTGPGIARESDAAWVPAAEFPMRRNWPGPHQCP